MSVRTLAVAVAALVAAGGVGVLTVTSAGADHLTCLAPVSGVRAGNDQALRDDEAGDNTAAAGLDTSALAEADLARQVCYFNPNVPYDAYENAIAGFTYLTAALSANHAGNVSAAVADARTAARYLDTATKILSAR